MSSSDTELRSSLAAGDVGKHGHENHLATVLVNDQPVKLLGHQETGREIKTAAIEQGVNMQLDFVLEEILGDGSHRVIDNDEKVALKDGLRFEAHARNILSRSP